MKPHAFPLDLTQYYAYLDDLQATDLRIPPKTPDVTCAEHQPTTTTVEEHVKPLPAELRRVVPSPL